MLWIAGAAVRPFRKSPGPGTGEVVTELVYSFFTSFFLVVVKSQNLVTILIMIKHLLSADFPWIIDTPDSWSTLPRWLRFHHLFSIVFSRWWWLSLGLTRNRSAPRAHLGFPSTTWSCLHPYKVFVHRGRQLKSAIFPSSRLSSFPCSPLLGSFHILHTPPHWMCTLDTVAPQGLCQQSPQGLTSGEEEGCTMWRATHRSWWSFSCPHE